MDTSKYTMDAGQLTAIINETERLVDRSILFFLDEGREINPNSLFNLQYELAADLHNHRSLVLNNAKIIHAESRLLIERLEHIDKKRKETLTTHRQSVPVYKPTGKKTDLGFLSKK